MIAFLAAALAAAQPVPAPSPTTPAIAPAIDWSAAARGDVEAGFAMMKDSHAGWHNGEDPGFRAKLERARAAGLAAADRLVDKAGYASALQAFSAVLDDGHALLMAKGKTGESGEKWPGFLAAWRGNAMYVVDGEAAPGLGTGSRILSCDGTPIAELLVQRLKGRRARLSEPGAWWAYGSYVLLDSPAQANGAAPRTCQIAPPGGGAAQAVTLDYQPVPKGFIARFWQAANGDYTDIGLAEPRPGLFIVGMPTFEVDASGGKMYRALEKEIARRHADLKRARAIVLDLRRNMGGSSLWPTDIAAALWGAKAVETRDLARQKPVEILWRTSDANAAYLESIDPMLREQKQEALADEVKKLARGLRDAAARGEPLWAETKAADRPVPPPLARPTLSTPVYVIVPGQCASACLDALDIFTDMPNVTLVGAPSAADSLYMEVREADLPSGEGFAVIPLKVWTHRKRGAGFTYWPRLPLRQADWSTKAFLDTIEADLSKRAATR